MKAINAAPIKFGEYQRECHALMDIVFSTRPAGYKWLWENFKIKHFSELGRETTENRKKLKDMGKRY